MFGVWRRALEPTHTLLFAFDTQLVLASIRARLSMRLCQRFRELIHDTAAHVMTSLVDRKDIRGFGRELSAFDMATDQAIS